MAIRIPQVQERGYSNVRVSPSAPDSAFGGTGGQVANATGKTLDTLTDLALKEKRRVDRLVSRESDRSLLDKKNELQQKFSKLKNKQAFEHMEGYLEEYEKHVKDVVGKLSNADQREAVIAAAERHKSNYRNALVRHSDVQMASYEDEVFTSRLESLESDASLNWSNPGAVRSAIDDQKDSIREYAKSRGKSKEWLDLNLQKVSSATHSKVIGQIIDGGDAKLAKAYFSEAMKAKEITGDDANRLKKRIESGVTREVSQGLADKIMGMNLDYKESIEKARALGGKENSKVRDELVQRVKVRLSERENGVKLERQDIFMRALNLSEDNPGKLVTDLVKDEDWDKLSHSQRTALRKMSAGAHDEKVWVEFFAYTPKAQLASLTQAEYVEKYRSRFDAKHREKADKLIQGARANPTSGSSLLSGKEIFIDAVAGAGLYGIDRSDSWKDIREDDSKWEAFAPLLRDFDSRVTEFEERTGKKPSDQDLKDIADKVAFSNVKLSRFGRDEVVSIADPKLIKEDERGRVYYPYDSIPEKYRQEFARIMRSEGVFVTDERLERAFGAYLLDDLEMFQRIVTKRPPKEKQFVLVDGDQVGLPELESL